tara:strand:+ start:1180 stop:1797 length:618 start_codon:yes stop_codon:yes gene_type:complete
MILNNYYWLFEKIIPEHICDDIIKFAKSCDKKRGVTGGYENQLITGDVLKKLKKTRDSHIVWLNENWINNLIIPLVNQANKAANWNFQWDQYEDSQFTFYNKNQHYSWHTDSWFKPYNVPGQLRHNKVRKITSMLMLSNKSDFEGGEVELDNRDKLMGNKSVFKINYDTKGTVICFPSFVWHRVKPVTKGTRYSMPTWYLGDPFK